MPRSPPMKRLEMILLLSLAILCNAGKATAQAATDPVEGVFHQIQRNYIFAIWRHLKYNYFINSKIYLTFFLIYLRNCC
jgi:hypothetical protein